MEIFLIIFLSIGVPIVLIILIAFYISKKNYEKFMERLNTVTSGTEELSAEEFLQLGTARGFDPTGVYVIHNQTQDKYYVGQSKNVIARVRAHLSGRGNGDLYADYKYGDQFGVMIIRLIDSEYDNLDRLEHDMIIYFDAYNNGYNRNHGARI